MSWRGDKRTSTQRGYGYKWQKARARYLTMHPTCVMCEKEGRITLANVVDHVKAHKGDQALFWDEGNWQALCKTHHDSDKQMLEKSGKHKVRIGEDGYPIEEEGVGEKSKGPLF